MYENILAVIPARGGSKGILHKNLQLIHNLPLFAYSVHQAITVGIPHSNIIVSSDDDEILKLSSVLGIIAHRRPDEICGDDATTESCLIDAWNTYQIGDTILTLQPTSPIRHSLKKFIDSYLVGDFDSGLAVTTFHNFFWMKRISENLPDFLGQWSALYDYKNRPRRQEIYWDKFMYYDNGNAYLSNVEMLLNTGCRLGDKVHVFPIKEIEGMQIDSQSDLETFRNINKEYFFGDKYETM